MKDRLNGVDSLWRTTLKQAVPFLSCKTKKPMERAKNGARYFRNPPQPHMCIQDSIQGCNEPCYINVLSWIKISTPRRPEDPIPLYGGMRIPCSNTTVMSFSADKRQQPTIFAVMANPEILRLSGKMAKDPTDRDALVDLMLDFVEAMNPDLKFNRQFSVLKNRDLTGELKDIWLAIQLKREKEKERPENGRRFDMADRDKHKNEVERHSLVGYEDGLTMQHQASNVSYEERVTDEFLGAGYKIQKSSNSETEVDHRPSSMPEESDSDLAKASNEERVQHDQICQQTDMSLKQFSERDAGDASPTRRRKVKVKQPSKLLTYSRDEASKQPCIKQAVFQEMPLSSSDSSEDEDRAANEENANEKCNEKDIEEVGLQCDNVESQLLLAKEDKHKTNGVKEDNFTKVLHDKAPASVSDKFDKKDDVIKSRPLQSINTNVFDLSSHTPSAEAAKDQENFAAQIGRNTSFVMRDCKMVGLQSPRN